MFSTEDLKTAIGATVIARRNAAARLREAGNPRDPFRALPGMEQQFFEAAQSVRSYDLVLNLLEREDILLNYSSQSIFPQLFQDSCKNYRHFHSL